MWLQFACTSQFGTVYNQKHHPREHHMRPLNRTPSQSSLAIIVNCNPGTPCTRVDGSGGEKLREGNHHHFCVLPFISQWYGSWEIRSGLICWFNFHHFHNNLLLAREREEVTHNYDTGNIFVVVIPVRARCLWLWRRNSLWALRVLMMNICMCQIWLHIWTYKNQGGWGFKGHDTRQYKKSLRWGWSFSFQRIFLREFYDRGGGDSGFPSSSIEVVTDTN